MMEPLLDGEVKRPASSRIAKKAGVVGQRVVIGERVARVRECGRVFPGRNGLREGIASLSCSEAQHFAASWLA